MQQATATKDDAAGGEGTTAHGSQLNTEQMRSPVSKRPSRKRVRTARFIEEFEEEGAPAARKRQKKNQKSQADKKGAKQPTLRLRDPKAYAKKLEQNQQWRERKKKESPDYFLKLDKAWRKAMLAKDQNYCKNYRKAYRKAMLAKDPNFFRNKDNAWRKAMRVKNQNYFKDKATAWRKRMLAKDPNYFSKFREQATAYRHLTLLRSKKHLQDYFKEIKEEVEKKKNKTSKRSIDELSDVFEYIVHHDSLLTKGLEEQLQVRQLQDSAYYNLRSTQVQCNVESLMIQEHAVRVKFERVLTDAHRCSAGTDC